MVTFGDLFGDSSRFFRNLSTALHLPEYGDRPSEDGAFLPPLLCERRCGKMTSPAGAEYAAPSFDWKVLSVLLTMPRCL